MPEYLFLGFRPATFFKEETLAQVFPCEFCQISKNTFFTEHLWATASGISWENKKELLSSKADKVTDESFQIFFIEKDNLRRI